MTAKSDEHWDEVDRLWRAVRRDLGPVILSFAGVGERNDPAWKRLCGNWERLCAADLDAATRIYHGVHEISVMMARYDKADSPAGRQMRQFGQMGEALGIDPAEWRPEAGTPPRLSLVTEDPS